MRLLLAALALSALTSCGGDGENVEPSGPGAIEVSTTTGGSDRDPDGYGITVDGAARGTVGPNATQHLDPLDPGDHEVSLSGVADNCSVSQPERTVVVRPGETTPVPFQVTCQAIGDGGGGGGGGDLDIITQTSGARLDTDGYILAIDGKDRLRVGVNDLAAFSSFSPGSHAVTLGDVAANCQQLGETPRQVTVAGGTTATATLSVSCS
jgi:hypothetical protein